MNEKRPSLPPPRTRPLDETRPAPADPAKPVPPGAVRRRRRVSGNETAQREEPAAAAAPVMFEEESLTPKRAILSSLGFLVIVALLGGLIYLYMQSMEKEARQADVVETSLRELAQELWVKGSAGGVTMNDPQLAAAILRIKKATGTLPAITIIPADGAGGKAATHEILYTFRSRPLLTVQVFADVDAGSVEIASFTPAPQFQAEEPKPEESMEEKLKRFGVSEKVLEEP